MPPPPAATDGSMPRTVDRVLVGVCGVLGLALCLRAGRIGLMPLDQSLVFDGAWRLLQGQVPWRDFMLPNGLVPIAIQAAIFELWGVSWTSYVVHAGVMNAGGAMLVFAYLTGIGLPRPAGLACAAATAVWLYPPMGTPYMDQHSLMFGAIAVGACWHGATTDGRRWWVAAGIAAALALFSKQVPALLILPIAGVALLFGPARRVIAGLATAIVSAMVTMLAILGVVLAAGASWEQIVEHTGRLPAEVGLVRLADGVGRLAAVVGAVRESMPATLGYGIGLWLMTPAIALAGVVRGHGARRLSEAPRLLLAAAGLLAATIVSCAVTDNDSETLVGLVPLAAAMALRACLVVVEPLARTRPQAWPAARFAMVAVFCAALVGDAVPGSATFGWRRAANDIAGDVSRPAPTRLAAAGFSGWGVPELYRSAGESLADLLEWFDRTPGNFLLIGDESIAYGLSRRPSVAPWLWFHPGLTFRNDASSRALLEASLESAMLRHAVRWVVIPANASWEGWNESTFPALAARLANRPCHQVGLYRVCRLD